MSREELRKRLLVTFREEAAEHLQALSDDLDAVLADPQGSRVAEHLETLFRVMHTLKGAARSVQLIPIEQICQECEAELRLVTRREKPLTQAFLDRMVDTIDRLRKVIETSASSANGASESMPAPSSPATPAPASPAPMPTPTDASNDASAAHHGLAGNGRAERGTADGRAVTDAAARADGHGQWRSAAPERKPAIVRPAEEPVSLPSPGSVRVDVDRLDRLMLAAEDLLLPSLVASERVRAARQMTQDLAALRARLRAPSGNKNGGESAHRLPRDVLDSLREIEGRSRHLAIALADDQRSLRAAVGDLFQETRYARMVPAASMLAAFPTMVRDLCRATGKEAKWSLKDSGLELDRKVIELIKAPLIHMVRNAIDHGLEKPEEREAAGKLRQGSVSVAILPADQGRIAIEIADDGRGMDLTALRDAAIRSRTVTAAQVKAMSDQDVIDVAFRPGVSTSAVITSISGLGLGLSIVREQVERIDGRVVVDSVPGKGTVIRLEIPSTVASYRGLLVSVNGARLLWPADSVERVIGVAKPALAAAVQSGIMVLGPDTLPFARLAAMMGIPASEQAKTDRTLAPCIVVANAQRRAIFAVDEILGETEVLIKDFPSPLRRVRNVGSVGLLATGELALVLRPADLLVSVQAAAPETDGSSDATARTMRVLVVDDSITTRTMERNLLEAAGYEVSIAADGLDAWTMLQEKEIDLVVSDVDMPRMNGFELASRIRGDSRLSELPIVLVTALESRDDKERGIKIGANAYVLKSSFEQSNLLEIVGRLI
jgi:two-component system chemotaxis sensor kinase CheA